MSPPPSRPPAAARRRFRRRAREGPSAIAKIRQTYAIARKHDRRILVYPIASAVLAVAVLVIIGVLIGQIIVFSLLGVALGFLLGANLFAFRAQKAMYTEVADRPGVALEVVRRMRGDWKITEAVQFNRNQDFVHRVISRAGVILIGEGRGHAVRDLLTAEARRTRRVASDVPLHEVIVGTRSGDIALGKLRAHLTKLPRVLKPAQVRALDIKLKAVANTNVPMPKGPMPTRVPRGKLR